MHDVLRAETPVHRSVVIKRMDQRLRKSVTDPAVEPAVDTALAELMREGGAYR